uniref:Uncharacterized protein n=1 Tax=Nelumbo nucifera TaxID=4432 RepID=A0A822XFH5_NELNU|nr:TPA_asm: hypothetical protein HUJ06_020420 [Nelumbo nucifera]
MELLESICNKMLRTTFGVSAEVVMNTITFCSISPIPSYQGK